MSSKKSVLRKKRKWPEYTAGFKVAAVRRVVAGESVSAVAREIGVGAQRLYRWRDVCAVGGESVLSRKGGRPVQEAGLGEPVEPRAGRGELLAARKRIAELERKVGQQELELDFFGEALRRVTVSAKRTDAKRSVR